MAARWASSAKAAPASPPSRACHDFRRRIQPVFQNPYASLDPRMTIAGIVSEPMLAQGVPAAERRKRTDEALARVGMSSADATRFPSEFSGGQRQRIAIARAIAAKPELIVLDEPVSSLDISVRAQVLNLLLDLKRDTGVGYLMISHDLRTLAAMCDDIAVMYLGRIVEAGPAQPLCSAPQHPYTRALFAASLTLDNARASPPVLAGEPPSPIAPPAGCAFHPRCPLAFDPCSSDVPELSPHSSCLAACHALAKTASTD